MPTRKWTQSIASLFTSAVLLAVPILAVLYLSPFVLGSTQAEVPAVVDASPTAKTTAGGADGLLRLAQANPEGEREESAAEVLAAWTYTMNLEVVVRVSVRITIVVRQFASFAGEFSDFGHREHQHSFDHRFREQRERESHVEPTKKSSAEASHFRPESMKERGREHHSQHHRFW